MENLAKVHKSPKKGNGYYPEVVFPPPLEKGKRWVATTTSKEGKKQEVLIDVSPKRKQRKVTHKGAERPKL